MTTFVTPVRVGSLNAEIEHLAWAMVKGLNAIPQGPGVISQG